MSDLSSPPLVLLPRDAEGLVAPAPWPTPPMAGYPEPAPFGVPPVCAVEGHNGHAIKGRLSAFDIGHEEIELIPSGQSRPVRLRCAQFRRLCLVEPLAALEPLDLPEVGESSWERPSLPFTVHFHQGEDWQGQTVGQVETAQGLFLFEPFDDRGSVRRWFVPRGVYREAVVGLRLGEALVAQRSLSPQQLAAALAEQQELRNRKIGDILVVRQIVTPQELNEAIEQQSRMPMVRIGEALVALGYITESQLDDALQQQRQDRSVPLGELLVSQGLVSRADLQTALARKMGYPLVDVMQFPVDSEALTKLPYTIASRVPALPLMMRGGRLVVAVEDPSNRRKLEEMEFAAQCKLVPVLVRSGVLLGAIERAYEKVGALDIGGRVVDAGAPVEFELGDASKLLASMETGPAGADDEPVENIEQSDNSLVRLINSMIVEAHSQGVSDIHVECPAGREKVRIRFRKDGILRPYLELPPGYRSALLARLKIMCDLDISERRKPQDGKINFAKFVQGLKLELRVATIPTSGGLEDAVLRLLQSSKPIPLDKLGLSEANFTRIREASARPFGMLLCVGPTGSGKTTTLHSLMGSINTPERKIWTAEDPVEITQQGLRQVQVNPRIDWTFAKALRAFLRADPDVIMVGEIRDEETAQVAVEASLTGHLLLSTLHTNSAPETVTRLLDMGMDPFNFADALLGVLAQRLVRRLCTQCRAPAEATPEELRELADDWLHVMHGDPAVPGTPSSDELMAGWMQRFGSQGRITLYRPVGCDHCGNSGYRGRAGIHELMMVSRELREMIQTGRRAAQLQQQALADGMRTLRQDGIDKVLAGITTLAEVRASS
jgi:type II secretory ATPase GspE/PulE/Tfp pilus assembly ATPase PilB-like protein